MSNLKPFNLERALAGDPVVTRHGIEVEEIYHFKKDKSEWCLGVVINGGYWSYCIDGTTCRPYEGPEKQDLFMKPVEKEYVVASYYTVPSAHLVFSKPFNSMALAESWADRCVNTETVQFHKISRLE